MTSDVDNVLLRIFDKVFRVVQGVFHYLLVLAYWSRGPRVPPVKDPILQMSATELARQIREQNLTSECIVRTFIDRILTVDPIVHAIVDRRFNEALQEAREADALVTSGTMTKLQLAMERPLLGVPFTVKVLITVKGLRSTRGSLLFKDVLGNEDAEVVSRMKTAGAIVLATTNSPEMGLNFESTNYAHGTTCNPYDTTKTSGGSSGGESALLAAAGSVIGIGNDLGGSIRIPSMFCGLFGHKPTWGLVSNEGCFPPSDGKLNRMLFTGPMCRYATDLVAMMKILASPNEEDMFERQVNFKDLNVSYMLSFGDMLFVEDVDPEIKNCVQKAASYFETKHGCKVKKATSIPLLKKSNGMFFHALLSSVPASDICELFTAGKAKLDGIQELTKFLFRQSKYTLGVVAALNIHSVPFIYDEGKVEQYRKLEEMLDKHLSNLLDKRTILILPTLPFAAPYHHEIPLYGTSVCYTHIFNMLGHPVTQCPVGFNRKGMPIGVQIVGRRGNDHLTIAAAVELEKAFGGWIPPN